MSPSDIDVNGSIQTYLIVTPARNEVENQAAASSFESASRELAVPSS